MGRYYNGDIEGKFMFAVQPSNAGERFGAEDVTSYIDYYVSRDKYDNIVKELNDIEKTGAVKRVQDMFAKCEHGYNNKIMEENGVSKEDIAEYADWRLGGQIKEWFDDNPEEDGLSFTAEL